LCSKPEGHITALIPTRGMATRFRRIALLP
jgi:hypothetical protein